MKSRRGLILFVALTAAGAVLDLVSKWMAFSAVGVGASRPVLGQYLKITPTYNPGGPMGLLRNQAALLSVLSVVAIVVIVVLVVRRKLRPIYCGALGLFMGGALGNLYDRVVYGKVRDFIDMDVVIQRVWVDRWFTYNLADAFICIGVALFIVAEFQAARREKAE